MGSALTVQIGNRKYTFNGKDDTIGEGGFAKIVKAERNDDGSKWALKIMTVANGDYDRRFVAEWEMALMVC